MRKSGHSVRENRIVAALPQRDRKTFLASCEVVDLRYADVICESGRPLRHAYFPREGFISLVTELDDGERLEVGMIGDEGMLGASLLLGVDASPQRALVQGAGVSLRMSAASFRRNLAQNAALVRALHGYLYVLMGQLAQAAACVHYHLVEQRLARWLLLSRDRAHSDEFHLTHEFLAHMLGVRRVGVTRAASALHARGLIDYRRGDVSILDSQGLEEAACTCYQQGNRMYESAFGAERRAPDRAPSQVR